MTSRLRTKIAIADAFHLAEFPLDESWVAKLFLRGFFWPKQILYSKKKTRVKNKNCVGKTRVQKVCIWDKRKNTIRVRRAVTHRVETQNANAAEPFLKRKLWRLSKNETVLETRSAFQTKKKLRNKDFLWPSKIEFRHRSDRRRKQINACTNWT